MGRYAETKPAMIERDGLPAVGDATARDAEPEPGGALQVLGARQEIVALTSLRGLAAMAVVMQHFSATAQALAAVVIPSLVPHGYLAVDLFFVLSGFIMSYTYLCNFQMRGRRAFGGFLIKRVARIVPLNTAVLALFLVAGAFSALALGRNIFYQSGALIPDLIANLLLLQGLGIGTNLNGPSWSISVEFVAYLAFPVLTLAMFAPGRGWIVLSGLCAGVLAGMAASQPRLGLGLEGMPFSLVRCLTEFIIGMACYRLTLDAWWMQRFRWDGVAAGLACGCVLFMVVRIDLPAVLLFPALIVALVANEGRVARAMAHPVLHFLGEISFSLYLIHQLFRPLGLVLMQTWHPAPLGSPAALGFAFAGSVAVVPFAWLTYRLVERPGRRLFRGFVGGARPQGRLLRTGGPRGPS